MKIIKWDNKNFIRECLAIEKRFLNKDPAIEEKVREIIDLVKNGGDKELFKLTKQFDKVDLSKKGFRVDKSEITKACKKVSKELYSDLKFSARRITEFHKKQIEKSWTIKEKGILLGQIIRPLEKVGIYAPGGKGAYPSSVLMNAIPAKVAGVNCVILCTPAPGGELNPSILAAAEISGVDEIYTIGGAQAIAALAFGTKTIPKVDKITGPGNVYVAEAKREVFGLVDIDMVAGPSEILIIADDSARADYIAADLISQAEHDEMAYPLLITTSEELATSVKKELTIQTSKLDRGKIINQALKKNCIAFIVRDIQEAVDLANRIAPEHLEIMTNKPEQILKKIKNAGAIFLGDYTPEAVGDYAAGPNHVLPTGGSARFFSPLGVYDFLKRTSLISFDKGSLNRISEPVIRIAMEEGFTGHAEAVRIRNS